MVTTRFHYVRRWHVPPTFGVWINDQRIGVVERTLPHSEGARKWRATLDRDPLVEGFGRTRDAAVDDALGQIGGLG